MATRIRSALFLFGVILIVLGFRELHVRGLADAVAQQMTCAELAAKGPGQNAHVYVTDFLLCDHDFVYEEEFGGGWTDVWVPLFPKGSRYAEEVQDILENEGAYARLPSPPAFDILVKVPRAKKRKDVQAAAARPGLQGLIINEIDSLGGDEKDFLRKTYPQVNVDKVWVLQLDRRPGGAGTLFGQFGGGALLLILGGLWLFFEKSKQSYDPRDEHYTYPVRPSEPRRPVSNRF